MGAALQKKIIEGGDKTVRSKSSGSVCADSSASEWKCDAWWLYTPNYNDAASEATERRHGQRRGIELRNSMIKVRSDEVR